MRAITTPMNNTEMQCPNCDYFKVVVVSTAVFEEKRRFSWLPIFTKHEIVERYEYPLCLECNWEGEMEDIQEEKYR